MDHQTPFCVKKKLLVVDDDEALRRALVKNLEGLGYEVSQAENGNVACDALNVEKVDLVISDIRMPEMDGLELTRHVKRTAAIPVLLMTGFSEALETQEAHSLGADEFLAKPFRRQDLVAAIEKCLQPSTEAVAPKKESAPEFCKVSVEDFVSGKQINFNIFIRLTETKYLKIANRGQDLSLERVRAYKAKGLHHLYLRQEDFCKYVGFSLTLTVATGNAGRVSPERRLNLLRHTGEILLARMDMDRPDSQLAEGAATFVESTVRILSEDPKVFELLEALKSHSDHHYAHGVAVSFYSLIIAQALGWDLPSNRFKVAMGGLLHDIGEKEIRLDLLSRPRHQWSPQDVQIFESHPLRGVEILSGVSSVPTEVFQIVKEHHEDGLNLGFPSRMKKSMIHPMARLIAVADIFCDRVVQNPMHAILPPTAALQYMSEFFADRMDPTSFRALASAFHFKPSSRTDTA